MDLLSNRKKLSSRESMNSLLNYARDQDRAVYATKMRMIRANIIVRGIFLGSIGVYTIWNFTFGYWQSMYPRSTLSRIFEGLVHQKRLIMVPELYLKDQERYYEDLRVRENEALASEQ